MINDFTIFPYSITPLYNLAGHVSNVIRMFTFIQVPYKYKKNIKVVFEFQFKWKP